MPFDRIDRVLSEHVAGLQAAGTAKGSEAVIETVLPARNDRGPRFLLAGEGERPFLRMNSNSYLGLSLAPAVIEAEERATRDFGAGPGAVRFISGTYALHRELESRLAAFHGRPAAMIFSSAYATTLGVLVPMISAETAVISDGLNHNCIINAIRLARPREKHVYRHLDLAELSERLSQAAAACRRAIVVTDGIFSMRGDHAPLDEIAKIVESYDASFEENAILIVDDSHGVGAFGPTGRGTEEVANALGASDLLVATLGKALGVNGGYVAGSAAAITYLRETASLYIYSNPITPGEAAAAIAALDILESADGQRRLEHLRAMTARFEDGLVRRGFETIPGSHPVVPLMVRDTDRTTALVTHLKKQGVLATGLNFPVVPKGDQSIRFQVSAEHTVADIDLVLDILGRFEGAN